MKEFVKKIFKTSDRNFFEIGGIYTFLNPVSYLHLRNSALLNEFSGIFCDGGILAKSINFFYRKDIKRFSFDMTSLAPIVFNHAMENHSKVFIIGSEEPTIIKAKEIIENLYPGICIAKYRHGFFKSKQELEEVAHSIVDEKIDIVIAGMGCGLQEEFLIQAKSLGFNGLAFTCGGFFHQLSMSGKDYYPKWIDKFNLRFIYRIIKEKHTRTRYLKAGILFPIFFTYDFIRG